MGERAYEQTREVFLCAQGSLAMLLKAQRALHERSGLGGGVVMPISNYMFAPCDASSSWLPIAFKKVERSKRRGRGQEWRETGEWEVFTEHDVKLSKSKERVKVGNATIPFLMNDMLMQDGRTRPHQEMQTVDLGLEGGKCEHARNARVPLL